MNSHAPTGKVSALTVLLSSSVVLGTITGVFYLVGGAWVDGYSHALGLTYLARLQRAEYIFFGSQILLALSYFSISVMPVVGLGIVVFLKRKPIPRAWESVTFVLLMLISSLLLSAFAVPALNPVRPLITSAVCPVTGRSGAWTFGPLCFALAVGGFGFFFFEPKRFRLMFLGWGIVASVFWLFVFGWAFGAGQLYGTFQIVEVDSTSLQLLVLGADDKNLVVLTPGINRAGHPEPRYLLRSDIKVFRVVGTASINDFVCNPNRMAITPGGR